MAPMPFNFFTGHAFSQPNGFGPVLGQKFTQLGGESPPFSVQSIEHVEGFSGTGVIRSEQKSTLQHRSRQSPLTIACSPTPSGHVSTHPATLRESQKLRHPIGPAEPLAGHS